MFCPNLGSRCRRISDILTNVLTTRVLKLKCKEKPKATNSTFCKYMYFLQCLKLKKGKAQRKGNIAVSNFSQIHEIILEDYSDGALAL